MEIVIELVVELFLELITEEGVGIITKPENYHNWPKGVKIALVTVTLLFLAGIIGVLIILGILFLTDGKIAVGLLLTSIGALFLILAVAKFRKVYKKKRSAAK